MQNEAIYIDYWKAKVADALGWSSGSALSDQDFEVLAKDILNKTGILLSITTLKRIWGKVSYQSTPSAATLNGLAQYIGYQNWRSLKDFVNRLPTESKKSDKIWLGKSAIIIPIVILSTFAILIILAWLAQKRHNFNPINAKRLLFSARKVTNGLPNSVVFDYNATGLNVDSIVLQQSWDESKTERLSVDNRQHTSIYYYPGYFWAKLIASGHILKEIPVYIKTQGWIGIIDKEPVPSYLNAYSIRLLNGLGITSETLAQKSGSAVFNGKWVRFYNVGNFNHLDGGNFKLDVVLQNTSTAEESACRKVRIDILGKRNAILIPLAEKGCVSILDLFTSSDWIRGKDKDMSAFGCDFSKPQHLICEVHNKVLDIRLNNRLALRVPITQTINEIAGIGLNFEGSGIISKLMLGNKEQIVLDEAYHK